MDRQPFLPQVDGSDNSDSNSETAVLEKAPRPPPRRRKAWFSLLGVSLVLNAALATTLLFQVLYPHADTASPYANLHRDREEPYVKETLYTSSNETLQASMWHSINIDAGMVALPDTWASSHDLRHAQRFPWDHSKGIYLLHGYHNLHCVKIIYNALHEYRHAQTQTRNWHHIVHCLDGLRRQIICDADDTPRATDRRAEVVTGVGQHRMCRSWDQLEAFASKNTACYRRPEHPEDGVPIIERFKHCPSGTGYVVEDHYVPVDDLIHGLPDESRLDGAEGAEIEGLAYRF